MNIFSKLIALSIFISFTAGYWLTVDSEFERWKAHDFECRAQGIGLQECEDNYNGSK
jgi:hypothetical protein